jgi:hypothetical protein
MIMLTDHNGNFAYIMPVEYLYMKYIRWTIILDWNVYDNIM